MTRRRSTSCGCGSTGEWHTELSPDADDRGIRVGFLSRLPFTEVERIRAFPDGTDPVRLQDDGTTTTQMGRGALRVRVDVDGTAVDLITAHLKSKLLQLPQRPLQPARRGRARSLRRLRARPAHRRGDHAARPRDDPARRPGPATSARRARRPQRRAARRDDADPARPARLASSGPAASATPDQGDGQRLWNIAPQAPRGPRVQPHLQRPPRADRPHPDQPQARAAARIGRHRHHRSALGHDRSAGCGATRRLRPRAGPRPLRAGRNDEY